ncbi:MAG: hypothetical protein ACR2L2_17750 [Acidobacteriota bacterium]
MTNQQLKDLFLKLLRADYEDQVIDILRAAGFWENRSQWRMFGDNENNYSTIGNQQARPEAAVVEKLINSVDARLMLECLLRGTNPEGPKAPKSIREAVASFFENHPNPQHPLAGKISQWSSGRRLEVAQGITFVATGARAQAGNPCFTICDIGEGQTPDRMPETLLSLNRSNKLRIPFVQGKFNMGGTGVLKFCGRHNLQLVVSRRHSQIANRDLRDESDLQWGFTIVRRDDPEGNKRSSIFTYLAPVEAELSPQRGGVLRFSAETLPLFPEGNDPYVRPTEWGTLVKLYEYHAVGTKGHILLPDGMLGRMDLLLPEVALPIRLHECRSGFSGHAGSWANTLNGLTVRLEDDRANNLEFAPISSPIKAAGEEMLASIYAFKKGRAKAYRKNEGIIFTLNGQTHGHFTKDFFSRKAAGRLDYIAESILVVVDCSGFSGRAREDFIMNSRDRLSGGTLRGEIEGALEDLLRHSEELRALREQRQREATHEKLDDSRPLENILEQILKQSPALSQLFLKGTRLSNPFKHSKGAQAKKPFKGRAHPTFFKFREKDYGESLHRHTPVNMRTRLFFETDAVDDYFSREVDRGDFRIHIVNGSQRAEVESYVGPYLHDGGATVSMKLPPNAQPGDELHFVTIMRDPLAVSEPFENRFTVTIATAQQPQGGISTRRKNKDRSDDEESDAPGGMALPNIVPVYEDRSGDGKSRALWSEQDPPFDKYTALRIRASSVQDVTSSQSEDIYDFFVNMDNIYLQTELKVTAGDELEVTRARFKYGMVLVGLALLYQHTQDRKGTRDEDEEIEEIDEGKVETSLPGRVEYVTKALAPMLLPVITSLAELSLEERAVLDDSGEAA